MSATRETLLALIRGALCVARNGYVEPEEAALDAILEAGFEVSNKVELDAWTAELKEANARHQKIARAAIQAADHRILLVELLHRGSTMQLLVCDPDRDEKATIERIVWAFGIAGIKADADKVREVPGPAPAGAGS